MRIDSLDSLRGMAASSVLFYHAFAFVPSTAYLADDLKRSVYVSPTLENFFLAFSPTSFFLKGHEWVVFFFVLSGFVLALPFYGKRPPSYLNFAVRRFCRLILPAAAVLALTLALLLVTGTAVPQGYTYFFNNHWQEPLSAEMLLRHLFLFPDTSEFGFGIPFSLNTPLWTLMVEWRVGLLFPLLILCARRSDWLLLAASAGALVASALEQRLIGTDELRALRWLPCFAMGLWLAKHHHAVIAHIQAMTPGMRALLWVGCIVLVHSRMLLPPVETQTRHMLVLGIGMTSLIALLLASPRLSALLEARPLVWMGQVAFSLYLCHLPLMLALPRILPDSVPQLAQMFLAMALAFPLATLLFRYVEMPSMELGRRLGRAADEAGSRFGWRRATAPLAGSLPAA